MQYGTIDKDLLEEFPELTGSKTRLDAEWEDEKSGQYVLFEQIFRLYVTYLLTALDSPTRDEKLRQVFSFVERMLFSGGEIENLGFISLLEGLPGAWLQLAEPYFGPRAEAALDEFDATWRERSMLNSSNLDLSSKVDLYRVKEVVFNILGEDSAQA